jgi:hypothetical protein
VRDGRVIDHSLHVRVRILPASEVCAINDHFNSCVLQPVGEVDDTCAVLGRRPAIGQEHLRVRCPGSNASGRVGHES